MPWLHCGSPSGDTPRGSGKVCAVSLGTLLIMLAGLVALVLGGELLVRGAGGLALTWGMSPLVVGLTVVAFATSAPELAVTLKSVLGGTPDIAVGNVVGSNVANVLLIIGVAAVIGPLVITNSLVRVDVPVMIGMGVLALVMSLDGTISTADGVILVICLALYLWWTIMQSRSAPGPVPGEPAAERSADAEAEGPAPESPHDVTVEPTLSRPALFALLVAGLVLLVLGAQWLVTGAVTIAKAFDLPEIVIGLTIVAVGTSLPELTTTIVAAVRGQRELAVGNAVGSNIFNIAAVLGISAIVADPGIPVSQGAIAFDLPVMIAVSFLLLPVVYTGFTIARWEGIVFLGLYAAYTAYLLLNATAHPGLPAFSAVMLLFVLPTIALSLAVTVWNEAKRRRAAGSSISGAGASEQETEVPRA